MGLLWFDNVRLGWAVIAKDFAGSTAGAAGRLIVVTGAVAGGAGAILCILTPLTDWAQAWFGIAILRAIISSFWGNNPVDDQVHQHDED